MTPDYGNYGIFLTVTMGNAGFISSAVQRNLNKKSPGSGQFESFRILELRGLGLRMLCELGFELRKEYLKLPK